MKKYINHYNIFLFFAAMAISLYSSQKPEITFLITLDDKDNPTHIGINHNLDEHDKFACSILNIPWVENANEVIWRVKEVKHIHKGQEKKEYIGLMNIDLFKDAIINSFFDPALQRAFCFSKALPDAFVRDLTKKKTITRTTDKTIVHFTLQNDNASLIALGLKQNDNVGNIIEQKHALDNSIQYNSVFKRVLYYALSIGLFSTVIGLLTMKRQ